MTPLRSNLEWITIAAALAACAPTVVAAGVISTFDTGSDGWSAQEIYDLSNPANPVSGGSNDVTWFSSGGNPGGFIRGDDIADNLYWFWKAPAKFMGDQSAAFGQSLSFDETQNIVGGPNQDPPSNNAVPDVILVGNGITLLYDTSLNPAIGSWSHFSLPLVGAGWTVGTQTGGLAATDAQMLSVLSNLNRLGIRAEFQFGDDHDDLDNVLLGTVPEPSSLMLAITAMGLIVACAPCARGSSKSERSDSPSITHKSIP